MEQTIGLSDVVNRNNENSIIQSIESSIKKTSRFLHRTIAQSPDADVLLAGAIVSYLLPELDDFARFFSTIPTLLLGGFAIKQYYWGHLYYNNAKEQLENKNHVVSKEAFNRTFPWYKPFCGYFGSRYAFREYQKNLGLK